MFRYGKAIEKVWASPPWNQAETVSRTSQKPLILAIGFPGPEPFSPRSRAKVLVLGSVTEL